MTDELLPHFLSEGRDLIQDAAEALLALERGAAGPIDRALLDRAFRDVHTLKGSTGLFDLTPMGALLHAAEDALNRLRTDPAGFPPPFDALLNALGACESWLDAIERSGALPADAPALAGSLAAALAPSPAPALAAHPHPSDADAGSGPAGTVSPLAPSPAPALAGHPRTSDADAGSGPAGTVSLLAPALAPSPSPALAAHPRASDADAGSGPAGTVSPLAPALAPSPAPALAAHPRASDADAGSGPAGTVSPADHPGAPDWLRALLLAEAGLVARLQSDGRALQAVRYRPAPDCFFLGDDPLALLAAAPEAVSVRLDATPDEGAVLADPFRCVLSATLLSTAAPDALRHAFRTVPDQVEILPVPVRAAPPPEQDAAGSRMVRVDASRIDGVVDLAGELLVARNALGGLLGGLLDVLDTGGTAPDPDALRALAAAHGEIDRLARALHREAAGLRLAPLDPLFRRLPRLVREIAAADGKQVELVLRGAGVELDRAVAEQLFEPLLHILRNAVGHGIETGAARRAAGKPERGRIVLGADSTGDRVVVTVSDDGAGIDPERLRALAAARALMDPAQLAALDAAGCLELVFLPGFSTADRVSELSGRGVGMDAVRDAVRTAGGRVSLHSRIGIGTEVRIELPREVSVTTALLCEAGGERFAVPIGAVREIVRPPPDAVRRIGAGHAFTLRDRVLPLLSLAPLLGLPDTADAADGPVLVLLSDHHPLGLRVDRVRGRADLLVRAPDGMLSGMPGLLGTAAGPDGRVLTVLDLADLVPREGADA